MLNHKLCQIIVSILLLMIYQNSLAKPEYVVPTGATSCMDCHLDNFGTGWKPGVLEASFSPLGKIAGLSAFLHPVIIPSLDTKPFLHPLNLQWDVTAGETPLVIPLRISDAQDDDVTIQGTIPIGMSIDAVTTDAQTDLQIANLHWQPTAAQANKIFTITLTAKETGLGRTLISNEITAKIHVWPARNILTKNINRFLLRQAQWINHKLLLAGKIVFKTGISTFQQADALAQLQMTLRSGGGTTINSPVNLSPDSLGNWNLSLDLTENQVPCSLHLEYEGLNVARTVKLAPVATCIK